MSIVGMTLLNLLISAVGGLVFGLLGSLLLKHVKFLSSNSLYELLTVFCVPFMAYSFIESLEY
jgi:NhaP-type Na+/H+ or K+/H+ antiporter